MQKLVLSIMSACLFLTASMAGAVDTSFSFSQAVNQYGVGTFSPSGPITMTGVVINNAADMLDYGRDAEPYAGWQVFIQSQNQLQDPGGAALYMGQWQGYTNTAWEAEMQRLMYSGVDGKALAYGDVIQVTTAPSPGMFHNGKYNINTGHTADPAYDFSISVVSRGTTPAATDITLAHLKNPDNSFKFDQTRTTGCEHYQGSLVHLDNLTLDDPADWGPDQTVTVRQGSRTFPLLVGLDAALGSVNVSALATEGFSVTAILDQEDPGYTVTDEDSPDYLKTYYTGGYRLWLTSGSLLTVPEPGSLTLLAAGVLTGLWFWIWRCRPSRASH
jgi:hypothetical protein